MLRKTSERSHIAVITASHPELGDYDLFCDSIDDLFFTENETNAERLWGISNSTPFVKDSINDRIVYGKIDSVNPGQTGTKASAHYKFNIPSQETISIRLRLTPGGSKTSTEAFADFDAMFKLRRAEADQFYADLAPTALSEEQRAIQRQALPGFFGTNSFIITSLSNG